MATTNVTTVFTGTTPFDVSVSAVNLLEDLSVKDFVIVNTTDAVQENTTFWSKISSSLIRYTGGSATLTNGDTIEIRRKTPNSIVQSISYASRFSSSLWNQEVDRIIRWREEADLNGVGPGTAGVSQTPLDTAFGASWDGDTIRPPTRNAVYDYVVTLAKIASPTFTGTPAAPTPATADNSTTIATTAYVKNNLTSYAPLASPSFTGVPTAPTASPGTNNTQLATTAFVATSFAPLASPALTGTPTAPTAANTVDSTQLATTAFVKDIYKPAFIGYRTTNSASGLNTYTFVSETEETDTDTAYNLTTFTVPSSMGGVYHLGASVTLSPASSSLCIFTLRIKINSTQYVVDQYVSQTNLATSVLSGSMMANLAATDTVEFVLDNSAGGGITFQVIGGQTLSRVWGYRLGV